MNRIIYVGLTIVVVAAVLAVARPEMFRGAMIWLGVPCVLAFAGVLLGCQVAVRRYIAARNGEAGWTPRPPMDGFRPPHILDDDH